MTDEAKLKQEIARSNEAVELLNNSIWRESVNTIEARILAEWKASPVRDAEGRDRLWMMYRLLQNLVGHIDEVVRTGKLAQVQLERERSMKDRLKGQLKEWMPI